MTRKQKMMLAGIASLGVGLMALGCQVGMDHYQENPFTFAVQDTLPEGNGKVARVILLGGQSNASGCSLDSYLAQNVSEEKYAEYTNGYDNVYIHYLAGDHRSQGFVKCATLQGELEGAFGPELGLAERLSQLYPEETFFIIKCAWGGTNLYSQWLSPSSLGKTGTLYQQFVAFVQASMDYLMDKNYNVQIAGMCWMQGESDAFPEVAAEAYGAHLHNFIKDVRKQFAPYVAEEGMVFVDAYIAETPDLWVYYEAVNRGKQKVAQESSLNVLVDTLEAGLTCSQEPVDNPDLAHYDSMSQIKLGHLFAEQLAAVWVNMEDC